MDKELALAKTSLLLRSDSTFLTTILFNLDIKWDEEVKGVDVDGLDVRINPESFESFAKDERVTLLAKTALYVALQHQNRRGTMEEGKYSKASSYTLNPLLENSSYQLPAKALIKYEYNNLAVNEVYDRLPDEDPKPDPMGIESVKGTTSKDVGEEINDLIVQAGMGAKVKGEKMPKSIEEMLASIVNPELPWEELFADYMGQFVKEDYSYRKPNKRYLPDIVLPTLHSERIGKIACAIDISYSVTDDEFDKFIAEVNYWVEEIEPEEIDLLLFSHYLASVHKIDKGSDLSEVEFVGRGGTSLEPVFEHYENKPSPEVLVIFSDLECGSIKEDPGFPVLWVVVNNPKAEVHFGHMIHIKT